jgi:negative regulator of sigma E activity
MADTNDVISAFLDNEPFDPEALGEALADPAGRAMLIDFVALRHVAREDPALVPTTTARRMNHLRLAAAAAAVLLALVAGYQLGERRAAAATDSPPAATRVVPATGDWR